MGREWQLEVLQRCHEQGGVPRARGDDFLAWGFVPSSLPWEGLNLCWEPCSSSHVERVLIEPKAQGLTGERSENELRNEERDNWLPCAQSHEFPPGEEHLAILGIHREVNSILGRVQKSHGCGSCDVVWWLNSMSSEVFPSLNDAGIPQCQLPLAKPSLDIKVTFHFHVVNYKYSPSCSGQRGRQQLQGSVFPEAAAFPGAL